MSQEEIRKLLGGYATNTLSESERNALFEAALENQELFNALQQEQTLKSLLANPAARAEIRQALERRHSGTVRWWASSGAIAALAAAAVLFIVFRPHPARTLEPPVQVASAERAPASPPVSDSNESKTPPVPAPKQPMPKRQARTAAAQSEPPRSDLPADGVPAAPPPILSQPVQTEAAPAAIQTENKAQGAAEQQLRKPRDGRDRVAMAYAPTAGLSGGVQTPVLRYSLLRRDPTTQTFLPASAAELKPGDLVRFQVSPPSPGRLILSTVSDTGQARPLSDIEVEPDSTYTLPDSPIQATVAPQKFRLTLLPPVPAGQTIGSIAGAKRAVRTSAPESNARAAASVEITVVANP
ncbi:MAG TPA: hypothetical protein VKX49_02070 [Bryobacteraceae bacterium]|nr:hypothetical protein [Bryobacteraceae bacterium]